MDRTEADLLAAAQRGDEVAFERLVEAYRGPLHAHCYRILGSLHDAEDAVQDALLGAWRGLGGFEGRSSLRSWLYRIATNASLKVAGRRDRRMLSTEYGPARTDVDDLGGVMSGPIWLEPYPGQPEAEGSDPEARYSRRESIELAFVAALQDLSPLARAVLILRDVLAYSAAEVAADLDTTVPAVNSALQRARATVDRRVGGRSQAATLAGLGEDGRRELVAAFIAAWERADVDGLVAMLAEDARFSMPPLAAWFDGRQDVRRFVARMLATPWRLLPLEVNGQLGFACYRSDPPGAPFRLAAVNVVTLRDDRIVDLTGFLDPEVHRWFPLPEELGDESAPPR
jgi:RNA polymerase sigma-70 factor (ECF subfamily)